MQLVIDEQVIEELDALCPHWRLDFDCNPHKAAAVLLNDRSEDNEKNTPL